ncbi:antibiotic biosynthesis monooxygenase family protein [Streptomyces sp. NPDC049954]|uniref:antibiotic biosynthesis monooxygenase family protein n=1 Tax=Streptomyces sp. NPDC049954 TaxID=3155779 RepID=UPI00343CFEEB
MDTADRDRARVVFLIKVREERRDEFLQAYEQIRHEVADGVRGHLIDQVCQSATDREQWLITSEWESLDDFEAWEHTPEHRDLVRPMRECFFEARSLRFSILAETSRSTAPSAEPVTAQATISDTR